MKIVCLLLLTTTMWQLQSANAFINPNLFEKVFQKNPCDGAQGGNGQSKIGIGSIVDRLATIKRGMIGGIFGVGLTGEPLILQVSKVLGSVARSGLGGLLGGEIRLDEGKRLLRGMLSSGLGAGVGGTIGAGVGIGQISPDKVKKILNLVFTKENGETPIGGDGGGGNDAANGTPSGGTGCKSR